MRPEIKSLLRGANALGCVQFLLAVLMMVTFVLFAACSGTAVGATIGGDQGSISNPPPMTKRR